MLQDYIHSSFYSIVLLGDFNPAIFQPFWLAEKKLIREGEATNATIEMISSTITKFKLDWIEFDITQKRLEARIAKDPFIEPARDLIIGIFSHLKETPIRIMGINNGRNLSLPDFERFYEFGNKLAPLSNWSDFMKDPRLINLEILENPRKDGYTGMYRVRVFPAPINLNIKWGVSITVNDHYELENEKRDRDGEIIKILSANWDNSKKRADEIFNTLLDKLNL